MLNILFRCDGSVDIGMGHVVRCLALADELRDRYSCNISFAMRKSDLGINKVRQNYLVFVSEEINSDFFYEKWLTDCIEKTKSEILIFDVRDRLEKETVKRIKEKTGIKIVTIDDPEDKRLESDLAFYPPVPQVKRMNWAGFKGKLYSGWEWVILRREFSEWKKNQNKELSAIQSISIPKILVTAGGSDPMGLTLEMVRALNMLKMDFQALIVLGPGFTYHHELNKLLAEAPYSYKIFVNVTDMIPIMSQSSLAVATFGMTAYELATMGIPAIYLCLTEDHVESLSIFVKSGMGVSLGVYTEVTPKMIAKKIQNFLNNKDPISIGNNNIGKSIDGMGVVRICQVIKEMRINV